MVLNYIWIAFFLIAFVTALMRLVFLGDTQVFPEIINSTFNSSKTAFEISLGLTGVLSLWLGIMRIGEQGGVITLFSRLLGPLFSKLFPDIPKGHPVTGSIFMNLAANMLGLDYDSRILMGRDIFSDTEGMVIFQNRSWITETAMYNASTGEVTSMTGEEVSQEYIDQMNTIVSNRLRISPLIVEENYYQYLHD